MSKPLRTLVIEDNEDDLELLLLELKRGGYNPIYQCVQTKDEMLQALNDKIWDIIFSDYSLPHFNGLAALELYRQKNLDIPFIILSGTIGEGTAVAAMKAGASDYFLKGNMARMIPAIDRELREAEIRRQNTFSRTVQSALYIISKAANANLPLDSFFRLVHAVLGELIPADNFYIALYDRENDTISFPYFHDQYDSPPSPRKPGHGMTEYILRTGKSILAPPAIIEQLIANGEIKDFGTPSIDWMGAAMKDGDEVIGVIAVQSYDIRVRYIEENLTVLNFIADQAKLLIVRNKTEEKLRGANQHLEEAYDSTLEGWSRALELRERETAGHSKRVVHLTLELARMLGLSNEDLIHIRRGALLHDIGKMGIPDSILLKPDKLTGEEWEIMRQHPIYAYQLLHPIEYLQPALDIPYAHHEKWNGLGYPRGLKGTEIPISARIFAIVDVWDALISDRPYSPAWKKDDVIAYIQSQANIQFDPKVVEAFIQYISTHPNEGDPDFI